ncbi:MAG: Sua5/YciO/YrdC/YwlC family protein, partial [Gemmatimonadota bacterium]|nr:Sua5/YciO/YrdC/YwlC family protein [Gemmatimonadota bacterium]
MTPAIGAVPFWSPAEVDAAIPGTIAHLQAHRVLAYPTETVYGIAALASAPGAMDRLRELKSRPRAPFSIHIPDAEQA